MLASVIQNQIVWNNNLIKIGNINIKNENAAFNFVGDFYNNTGHLMSWVEFKECYLTSLSGDK